MQRYYYYILAVYNPVIIQPSVWSRWFYGGSIYPDHIWSRISYLLFILDYRCT